MTPKKMADVVQAGFGAAAERRAAEHEAEQDAITAQCEAGTCDHAECEKAVEAVAHRYPDHYMAAHLDVERRIVDLVITEALKRGWFVSVSDGEEWTVKKSADYGEITAMIAATDETKLAFHKHPDGADGFICLGWVYLVHGNDEDVIADYSDNDDMSALAGEATAEQEN